MNTLDSDTGKLSTGHSDQRIGCSIGKNFNLSRFHGLSLLCLSGFEIGFKTPVRWFSLSSTNKILPIQ
jgi:hypothetical protein